MIELTLNRDYYSKYETIMKWCEEHFGHGGFTPAANDRWQIGIAFGHQFYKFKHESDASMFALKWL